MNKSKYILVIMLLIFVVTAVNLSAVEVAYVVGDTNVLENDTCFVNRLESRLGYNVTLVDDDAVDTISNWSELYDGIIISDLVYSLNMAPLKDTAVGIFTMDRYTEDEFGIGATRMTPSGHGRRLVNYHSLDFVCGVFMDTIFPYQYDNQYIGYYGELAEGAVVVFNTPDYAGRDTACVVVVDQEGLLIDESLAVERRAFCGVFRIPDIMDYCQSWELFDRLVCWVCHDTANTRLSEYSCWGGHLEIDACWCELTTSSQDSATYNSEFRFGFDYDDIISFWRLCAPEKKVSAGYECDSMILLFPISTMGFNGTPDDSIMDIDVSAFRISKSEKWQGPPPYSGGDPYEIDSTWVTRWDAVSGSSPVPWDTLDLRGGIDYAEPALDVYHLFYPDDSTGDTIRFKIPGEVLDMWASDTADNNGLVFKVTQVYDSASNIEYSTCPPISNATANPMTVEAWFSISESEEGNLFRNVIGEGVINRKYEVVY